MAEELVDIVILGASGFTGKYVLRELLKFANPPNSVPRKIAIAGRSKEKLAAALTWASGDKNPSLSSSISIYEADVNNVQSLITLCKKTKVLVSCVGPYRKYGRPVVEACVEAGVDYLDITGEPEFMEQMEHLYHEKASQTGSLVVSACGYDSIPAEFGVIHNTQQWESPSVPNSVDSYLILETSGKSIKGNIGTWESLVLGVANQANLQKFRKSRPRRSRPQIPTNSMKRGLIHWEETTSGWAIKLPSADATVVRRTHATVIDNPNGLPKASEDSPLDEHPWTSIKPVHYGCYVVQKSVMGVIGMFILGFILVIFAQFKYGQKLLVQYPELFSLGIFHKEGPSEEEIQAASFKLYYVGRGYSDAAQVTPSKKPDKEIVTRIVGPEIGYVTTPIVLIQAALVMLDERRRLPKGGVLTPGVVFGGTDYLQRLQQNRISFDVISNKKI
ncbi:probable mitochondrial saccharopine dehydrogenase-like oxidoreductase At5g39410 [Physcomitrium patens]|uniref:probable mitochondrial saccharopine dehydrogenase-like oxidoreductase At5g39410 n=1 Tax=Physcomitrium patens TaxID=3218 RepID=UPI0001622373|nr:probable mitochondrial saccharopine dehydrogenase-like oxidoreductase At5g39410 [Physcomitrium patens]|eukprot:XP_024398198.1 probable mitochondrial saccharopine dehydrogenase-like oxidoreductase At5g39410 [Physcomitrella patens]